MIYDILIKNGTVVTAGSTFQADLAVSGEQIAALGAGLGDNARARREIDASGKYVIPGAVDIHVHMELALPGNLLSSDTFFSGTRAAAFGGTTAVVDFVDPRPEELLLEALAARRAQADPQVAVDYGLHMTLSPAEMDKLEQVAEVYRAGCATFKLYMAYSYRLDDGQLLRALEAIQSAGGLAAVHAENWEVIQTLVARNLALGHTEPRWHPRSRPALLEGEATGRVIDIARYAGAPLHILHVSCAEAAQRIRQARQAGQPVSGETCPQYLFLTTAAFEAPGVQAALPICSPPLRSQADQEALWQALADGDLQMVSTDHCPFLLAEKERGWRQNFSRIPGGVPSIEMRLAAVFSGGVQRGRLSLNQWVDLCCTQPAKLAGFQHKGEIALRFDADLVIFDPQKEMRLSTQSLHENVDWTPYEGMPVRGWPVITLSRGRVIVEDGEFKGEAGWGKYVTRSYDVGSLTGQGADG